MASNETVAEIVREMFEYPKSWGECNHLDWKALAKRIQEAHDHELDVQYGRISRLVGKLAAKDDERLTIVANYENVIAAKDRIIAVKDAEIAELRECLKEASGLQLRCESCKVKHCDSICMLKLKWRKALEGGNDAR